MMKQNHKEEVPIWHKWTLSIDEAVAYSNIGECKLRELLNDNNCPFVLFIGRKMLIKRIKFEEFLEKEFSL